MTVESVPIAEYQEWLLQGFLKRTKIGHDTMYDLEYRLQYISAPIGPKALVVSNNSETLVMAGITSVHSAFHNSWLNLDA